MNKEQLKKLEADLWSAADKLRANSDLKSSEYATPVLGLIFLKFADNNYRRHEKAILAEYQQLQGTRREKPVSEIAIEKCGFYLPDHTRYDYLLNLPEEKDIAKALKEAMKAIEEYKPELEGVLPKDEYAALTRTDKTIPQQLLRSFADIPANATGDLFGQIYEYFLSEFARSEGQKGGEFFTPRSVVRLMVEIIEPHGGKVFDPACGSGGMFVQSAQFIEAHRNELKGADSGVYVCGQVKTQDTVKLAKMNLAVNGLRGEIKQANTYYEDPYDSFGAFDYVLANPPFNVDDVSLSSVEKDRRFNTYGIPRNKSKVKKADEGKETVPNGNYLWISLFATSLKPQGRAHREFSEEHIQNIALISHLHKGQREKFVQLVERYFTAGMERLIENNEKIEPVCAQLLDVLDDAGGKQAVEELLRHWRELDKLVFRYVQYQEGHAFTVAVDRKNKAQQQLREAFDPFFSALHEGLKRLDKTVRQHEKQQTEHAQQEGKRTATDRRTKALKSALEELHQDVKNAEIYFQHIHWLQERFPNAQYEDVTGLCKLATPEEIKEQDYSLNPGRYVGVVIEEDGKSEEEFIAELLVMNDELAQLNEDAKRLESVIACNVAKMVGEE